MSVEIFPVSAGRHWRAAGVAILLSAVLLGGAQIWAERRVAASTHALAARAFPQKDQGLAWQRAAARAPDILPLYGSSELTKPIADKASEFFAHAPTGFEISPLGKVGTTSLPMLQRLGGLGPDLRGKKVVISISPSWFFTEVIHPHYYEGNFSVLAASQLLFGSTLSLPLKHDLARRLQLFPRTFEKTPLLGFAVDDLAADTPLARLTFFALWPLGRLQTLILSWQDDFESVLPIWLNKPPRWSPQPATPDWPALRAAAQNEAVQAAEKTAEETGIRPDDQTVGHGGGAGFLTRMKNAHEWIDFKLLLRTLTELHAQPLLLSMPMNGAFYDRAGVPRTAREAYYQRIRALAEEFHFPLVEFTNRDEDATFLDGHHDHLSAKGWMVYDQILDAFFHDRPLPE